MTYEREETHEFTVHYGLRRTEDGDAEILVMAISGDGGAHHHPDDGLLDEFDSIEEATESDEDAFVYDTLYGVSASESDDEILRAYFE